MKHLAKLESLEDFFGAKAVLALDGIEYERNEITFDVDLDAGNVWFRLWPQSAAASLSFRTNPFGVFRLSLVDISHVSVRKTTEDHLLKIRFNDQLLEPLVLHLRPRFMLLWGNDTEAPREPGLERVDA